MAAPQPANPVPPVPPAPAPNPAQQPQPNPAPGQAPAPAAAAAAAVPLNQIDAATLSLMRVTDGKIRLVPAANASSHVSPGLQLVQVGNAYNIVAQIAYSEAAGVDTEKAAFVAGIRSGYFQAALMLNFIIRGNSYAAMSTLVSAGVPLNYALVAPDANGAHTGAVWQALPDQNALDALLPLAAGYVGECGVLLKFVEIGGANYHPALRRDEVVELLANHAIPQGLIDRLADPGSETSIAVREGAEFAMNAAVLNAVHRIRTMGHNWITKLAGNVCHPFLIKMVSGTKLNRKPKWLSEVMHDGLHMFFDLVKFVATCMASAEASNMFTEAAFFRWPVVQPGTGIVSSGSALWKEASKLACDHVMSPSQIAVYNGLANAVNEMANDVRNHAGNWAPGPSVHRASRNQRQSAAQQLVAYIYGYALGLGMSEEATQMQAASCVAAYNTCPAMGARGLTMGKSIKAADAVTVVTTQNLGIDAITAEFTAAW